MSQTTLTPLNENARKFISKPKKLFIGGKWVDAVSGEVFATKNSATGEVITTVPKGSKEDIDLAVRAAREAFDKGSWRTMKPAFTVWNSGSIGLCFVLQTHPFQVSLICSSCSSVREFASSFLQIPRRHGHPCLQLTVPTAKPVVDFHHQVITHAGRTSKKTPA